MCAAASIPSLCCMVVGIVICGCCKQAIEYIIQSLHVAQILTCHHISYSVGLELQSYSAALFKSQMSHTDLAAYVHDD